MNRLVHLLIISVALFITNDLAAQACIPDPNYTSPGIYPDSATGWTPANEGVLYSQVITAVVPGDTMVDFGGSPQQVIIDSIVLLELANMPAWLSLICEPPGCAIPGDSIGCGIVTGTPPPGSAGVYKIDLITQAYGRPAAFPTIQFDQIDTVIGYFTLVVNGPSGIVKMAPEPFQFTIVPNPNSGAFKLSVQMPVSQDASITILNIIGQAVYEQGHSLRKGSNEIAIQNLNVPEGNYFVTVRSGNSILTKRLYIDR